jgi:hypothetical protein
LQISVKCPKFEHRGVAGPRQFRILQVPQRNDNKFAGISKEAISKGKAGFGIRNDGSIVIMVQPHGGQQAMSYSSFRDSFINYGCNTAVCSDGSDSVFLTHGEVFLEKAGQSKDATQTIGIGFKSE